MKKILFLFTWAILWVGGAILAIWVLQYYMAEGFGFASVLVPMAIFAATWVPGLWFFEKSIE